MMSKNKSVETLPQATDTDLKQASPVLSERSFLTKKLTSMRKLIAGKTQLQPAQPTASQKNDNLFLLCSNSHRTLLVEKEYLKKLTSLQLLIANEPTVPLDLSAKNQQPALLHINQIWDSVFDIGTGCWTSDQTQLSRDFSKDWILEQGHTAHCYQGENEPNDKLVFFYNDPVIGEYLPVNQREYYQIGGSFSCHRCDALLAVEFYTTSKEKIQTQEIEVVANQFPGGKKLKNYRHISETVQTPENAAFVKIALIKLPTKPNLDQKDSFLFFTHLFFTLVATPDTTLGWSKNPFSDVEWQTFRRLNANEMVGIHLQLPRSIFDYQQYVINLQNATTNAIILSETFCNQRSNYHWELLRANLSKKCGDSDWKAAARLLLDWLNNNQQDTQLGKLPIVNHTNVNRIEEGVFETVTVEVLHVLRNLTEFMSTEPCVWAWLVEVTYQLGRYKECLTAYDHLIELATPDETDSQWLTAILATSLEKSYRYEEAFHVYLRNWTINGDEKSLKKASELASFHDNLQLSPEETSWLCRTDFKNKQREINKLIATNISHFTPQALTQLLAQLDSPCNWITQVLAVTFERSEITRDWAVVLTLLEFLDKENLLVTIPDWLAVEILWMAVQLEQLIMSSEQENALYQKNLARLKSFQFWSDVAFFDQQFLLLDQNYLRYEQSWKQPPKTAITSLKEFLSVPESVNMSPHILFDADWYANHEQPDKNARHLFVDFFRQSNSSRVKKLSKPNPYFDCDWYQKRYLAENQTQHPLLHYLRHFQETGIQPSQYFNNDYVRETQCLPDTEDSLSYYLEQLKSDNAEFLLNGFSPSPFFDRKYYLQHNRSIAKFLKKKKSDPFVYFIEIGLKKGQQAYAWQRYNQIVRHQRPYLEPFNWNSRFKSKSSLQYIKSEKAEAVYFAGQQVLAKELHYRPLISILVPVYQVNPRFLNEMIESVISQTYDNWQLCMVDDSSKRYNSEIKSIFKRYAENDSRIIYRIREENGHICRATNDCLALAKGEYVALLDHDDLLTPDALYEVVQAINKNDKLDIIYSDEDKVDEWGMFYNPYYKPDWSPHSLWSRMYVCHLTVYRKALVDSVNGFRIGFEGSQDYDLLLRCSERTSHIHHIPRVLYHWRSHTESTASSDNAKNYCSNAAFKAVKDTMLRRKLEAKIDFVGKNQSYLHVKPKLIGSPWVDIIIPNRNAADLLETCLQSIFEKTTYKNFKVSIIDNNSDETDFFTLVDYWLSQEPLRFQVIRDESPFNFSVINNSAVKKTEGNYLLFLNNDTEVITKDWLEGMIGYSQLQDVGAVGVKLLYPDKTIQHAGVATGIAGVAGHVMKYSAYAAHGYFSNLALVTNYSAVTAACLMISREKFNAVNGFTEYLQVAFNDVDFCLKVHQKGFYNVYLPFVELYHYESKSRGYEDTPEKKERFEREIVFMRQRWGKTLENDPFYSPWLTLDKEDMDYRFH